MHVYLRGDVLQRLRLMSGLVLFVFAGTHFLNHALGLVGLEAMHAAQDLRTAVTRSLAGTVVLAAALATHVALALYKTAQRETWRMPSWEAAQIASGVAIPFLLLPHIVNTRLARSAFAVEDSYLYELVRLWPDSAVLQSTLLLLVWVHGCIGLHHWLRLSETYRRAAPALGVLAVAVPLLALAGFAVAGRTTADIMSDPDALNALKQRARWPDEAASAALAQWRLAARVGFALVLAGVLARALWRVSARSSAPAARPLITYAGGETIEAEPGQTLLEASRAAGIAHASVCGGRARCSTCRVRIERGAKTLPPPEGAEAITLAAIDAPGDVRLACQIRPTAPLRVALLSRPGTPGPVETEFDEVREVVAAHARAVTLANRVELRSGDAASIKGWFAEQGLAIETIPDLGAEGFVLAGARIDYLAARHAAVLVYERDGRPLDVFVAPGGGDADYMVRATRHGHRVLGWADGARRYFAVSSAGSLDLERLPPLFTTPPPEEPRPRPLLAAV